jgi:hypothetical protein
MGTWIPSVSKMERPFDNHTLGAGAHSLPPIDSLSLTDFASVTYFSLKRHPSSPYQHPICDACRPAGRLLAACGLVPLRRCDTGACTPLLLAFLFLVRQGSRQRATDFSCRRRRHLVQIDLGKPRSGFSLGNWFEANVYLLRRMSTCGRRQAVFRFKAISGEKPAGGIRLRPVGFFIR